MANKVSLILSVCSVFIYQVVFAQVDLFQKISAAVDADLDQSSYSSTLDFLDKQGCIFGQAQKLPYLEETREGLSKYEVRINSVLLEEDKEIYLLSRGTKSRDVSDFYRIDNNSIRSDVGYIKIGEYFDSKLSLEENRLKGFQRLISLLRTRKYNYVILLDDFGLSPYVIEKMKEYFGEQRSTIFLISYNAYKANFPEPIYYYTEISSSSEPELIQKSILKLQNSDSKPQSVALTAILPRERFAKESLYMKAVLYSYVLLSKQMPGVQVTLYLIDFEDINLLKKKLFKDISKSEFSLGNIVFRDMSATFPAQKLFVEGQNLGDIYGALNASKYKFRILYTENNDSREVLVPSPQALALIIGPPNSEASWGKYDQQTLDDLVRFQRSYIQTLITTKAESVKSQPKAGF